jgi:hypothetical protein
MILNPLFEKRNEEETAPTNAIFNGVYCTIVVIEEEELGKKHLWKI